MKKLRKKLMWAGIAILAVFALVYSKTDVTLIGLEAARFSVVQAVGEQNVFHIENTVFKSVDRIVRDGHVYSDKPLPLGWTLGMFYKIPHRLFGLNFTDHYYLSVYLVNLLFSGTVNVLIFVWMFRMFCRVRRGSPYLKFFLALGVSLGTWLLSYSVTLNNHTPAALGVLGLYIVLEKFRRVPLPCTGCHGRIGGRRSRRLRSACRRGVCGRRRYRCFPDCPGGDAVETDRLLRGGRNGGRGRIAAAEFHCLRHGGAALCGRNCRHLQFGRP